MASYHCSIKVLSRAKGRSSVQFSSYMGGEKEFDQNLFTTFDKTSREDVAMNMMICADRVPEDIRTPEKFWNHVELSEKGDKAQAARTWEIALPNELSLDENKKLAEKIARSLIDEDGMPAVQVALHNKKGNIHVHIMAPLRDMDANGKWLAKTKQVYANCLIDGRPSYDPKISTNVENRIPVIDEKTGQQKIGPRNKKQWKRVTIEAKNWNSKEYLKTWRKRAEVFQNEKLKEIGSADRVSCQSYKDQGIAKIPMIHEGYHARQMGEASERVQKNLEIQRQNNEIEMLQQDVVMQQNILDNLLRMLQEFIERVKNVREQIAERIRRIAADAVNRSVAESTKRDRSVSRPEPGTGSTDRRNELENRGADRTTPRERVDDTEAIIRDVRSKINDAKSQRGANENAETKSRAREEQRRLAEQQRATVEKETRRAGKKFRKYHGESL